MLALNNGLKLLLIRMPLFPIHLYTKVDSQNRGYGYTSTIGFSSSETIHTEVMFIMTFDCCISDCLNKPLRSRNSALVGSGSNILLIQMVIMNLFFSINNKNSRLDLMDFLDKGGIKSHKFL
jgi:hypothetical protein